jgi:phosphohistidine swiveling domain-containing protein
MNASDLVGAAAQEERFNEQVWFNWHQPAAPLLLDLTFEACGEPFRQVFGFPFFTSVLYYRPVARDGEPVYVASWLLRLSEGVAVGRLLVDLLLLPSFAAAFASRWEQACSELLATSRAMRSGEAAGRDAIADFRQRFIRYYALGAVTEPVQWFCEAEIRHYFEGPDGAQVAAGLDITPTAAAEALYTMSEEPYAFTIERELLEFSAAELAGDLSEDALAAHAERFHWKRNNYARVHETTSADVRAEVTQLSVDAPTVRRESLVEGRKRGQHARALVLQAVPTRIRRLAMLVDEFGSGLADRRKAVMNEALAGLNRAAVDIAEQWSVPFGDLRMLSPTEIARGRSEIGDFAIIAGDRRNAYVQTLAPSPLDDAEMAAALSVAEADTLSLAPRQVELGVAEGESARELLFELDASLEIFERGEHAAAVRGQVAARPEGADSVVGRVRVVYDPVSQAADFREGEVLVAPSTTPDFVPLMRRAAAIVTNMGGLLQHAAHFAREENKPCIVGTGYATSSFNSGDLVSINFRTGEITLADG